MPHSLFKWCFLSASKLRLARLLSLERNEELRGRPAPSPWHFKGALRTQGPCTCCWSLLNLHVQDSAYLWFFVSCLLRKRRVIPKIKALAIAPICLCSGRPLRGLLWTLVAAAYGSSGDCILHKDCSCITNLSCFRRAGVPFMQKIELLRVLLVLLVVISKVQSRVRNPQPVAADVFFPGFQ